MSMAKKRKKHEEHVDESWLIPYADMLTLLLALFIVLFAASTVDAQKFQELMQSFNEAFSGSTAVMEHPAPVPPVQPAPNIDLDFNRNNNEHEKDDEKDEPEDKDEKDDPTQEEIDRELSELEELQKRINAYIEDNNLQLSLKTELTDEGLLITIMDHALFDSGSAIIKQEAEQLAREISILLDMDPPRYIQVAGHTDDVPMNNEQFRSNWDLSAMRAINFLKIILENDNLEPSRFSANAFGEYQPVATNETASGRQQNRRVEVLILPNYTGE